MLTKIYLWIWVSLKIMTLVIFPFKMIHLMLLIWA